jgi:Holliday junction DNA helicase RuvA
VGYEVTVPLGVMEKLPAVGERVTLATELVVREDAQFLFGFLTETEKRFFQRLLGVSGVGPRTALALLSTLGVERGSRAIKARDIATLASVSGIGKKTAERLALELADRMGELAEGAAPPVAGPAEAAVRALERLGYSPAEADKAVRQVLAGDGGIASDSAALVRRALEVLTAR